MKKVLLAFAILGFVACNNEGAKTEGSDTTTTVVPSADTVTTVTTTDTTVGNPGDTTIKKTIETDTTKKN